MSAAKNGDTVRVHYTGTLDNGTEFDSSLGREPLEFTLGAGGLISGFENAVRGMSAGEVKTVTIAAGDAYGSRNDNLIQEAPRGAIPDEIELAIGLILHAQGPDGQRLTFQVADFDEETVTLDGNHPLAGEDLTFRLELVEIV